MKKVILMVIVLMLPISIYSQNVGIYPTKHNILYKGIENPVRVLVENYSCDSIFISSNIEVIRINVCDYLVVPNKTGSVSIMIEGIKNGDTIKFGIREFRVLTTPDPVAKVGGKSNGAIRSNYFNSVGGITAELDDFDFEVHFRIKSYVVIIERNENIEFEKDFTGNTFPPELRSQFMNLTFGDKIRFEKLFVTEPDKSEREITPISFEIR